MKQCRKPSGVGPCAQRDGNLRAAVLLSLDEAGDMKLINPLQRLQ